MDARAKTDRRLTVAFRLIRWVVAMAVVFVSSVPTAFSQGAGCVKAVCFDGSVHPCGFDCSTLVKGSGKGSSGGYDAGTDPMMDNFTATMQTFFTTMDFVDSLLAEEKAKQARREQERERQRQAQQARNEEIDRLRQVANQKLMGSLKLGSGTKLQMKSLDGGGGTGDLRLKGIEDQPDSDIDLRPKGTAFFGLGGEGPPMAPAGGSDVVDLRNFRRAAFLAEAVRTASPEDRPFFIGEALRAADGDTSVIADVPPDAVVVDSEEKFIDFQEASRSFAAAQESVRAASERLSLAERRVFVIKEGLRRAEMDLVMAVADGANPAQVAEKRRLVEDVRNALALSRQELEAARLEEEIATTVFGWMGWGRVQDVVALGGGSWETPAEESLSKLERIYGRGPIDVPLPEIPGWVVRAENGRRAIEKVHQYENRIVELPERDQAEARLQLDRVRHKAELMDYYDQVINASTLERTEAMRQLQELRYGATQTMDGFYKESLGTLESAVSDFRSAGEALLKDPTFLETHHALKFNSQVQDAKSLASDIAAFRKAAATGSADFVTATQLSERASKLAVSITKDMEWLKKYNPELAERMLGRSAFWLGAGHGLARTTHHTMDVLEKHQATRFTSDLLGDRAISLRKIKDLYQKQVDGFSQRSTELEKLLAPGP